ncbi:MAG: nitrogen fixation protein NifH [Anaerolineae bacterium]|nr:nitrogen fixation protein NifH [Anaerolineae bacterium]
MTTRDRISTSLLDWLLEPENPIVRYLTLRDLLDRPPLDAELAAARAAAHTSGLIPHILDEMQPEGYWIKPGYGYAPKYHGTVWSIILLGQLGAVSSQDARIEQACAYLLEHALLKDGQFSATGSAGTGNIDCLQGNLCAALLDLGCTDQRLDRAFEWMARSVTGEGIAPATERRAPVRYYASGKCAPGFACSANNKLPCAWGAVKVMLAFSKLPRDRWTPLIERAIAVGRDFLFSVDPALALYPTGWSDKPSGNWWKFGFPVFYVTDLLQNVEALVGLGYSDDPRLENALNVIRRKQDESGRWALEYHYNNKTWLHVGTKNKPSKWVTLRALRVLKDAAASIN